MDGRYPPISDYALLSDCNSAALVCTTGAIDWACLRRFDAKSVFGRLLDWESGGCFALGPVAPARSSRRYLGDSLVLETRFDADSGSVRLIDALAMHSGGEFQPHHHLIRVVEGLDGEVEIAARIEPRFDYGGLRPLLRHHADTGAYSAVGGDTALVLSSDIPLDMDEDRTRLEGRATVRGGERVRFSVQAQQPDALDPRPHARDQIDHRLAETVEWWHQWSSGTVAADRHADEVRRSAVVLKGLTCGPTGAVVAAPTTSLPERIGGARNWDYRYSWIRDASLVVAALAVAGQDVAARGFRDFLLRSAGGHAADLRVMYGLDGSRFLPEYTVPLEGYRGSQPVRIGNAAYVQPQHDTYGHLLDLAHLWHATHGDLTEDEWWFLCAVVDRAAAVWDQPDHGIWEMRGPARHFVHSKAMVWVALDRGIRFVEEHGFEGDAPRWRRVRDEVREAVETRGVRNGHFVQEFGTDEVDAALLALPMTGFVPVGDERMVRTVERIQETLRVPPGGLVRRYRTDHVDDGVPGHEGIFLMCSFWLVDVLAMQGRVDEAEELFATVLATGNDLGLFSEQCDPSTGELLGNFPQAFTHVALINSAHQLACAHGRGRRCREQPWTTADRVLGREQEASS